MAHQDKWNMPSHEASHPQLFMLGFLKMKDKIKYIKFIDKDINLSAHDNMYDFYIVYKVRGSNCTYNYVSSHEDNRTIYEL